MELCWTAKVSFSVSVYCIFTTQIYTFTKRLKLIFKEAKEAQKKPWEKKVYIKLDNDDDEIFTCIIISIIFNILYNLQKFSINELE